jgi:hypothetical protein
LAALVELPGGEVDDMEGVHHGDRVRQLAGGGADLQPASVSRRDTLA